MTMMTTDAIPVVPPPAEEQAATARPPFAEWPAELPPGMIFNCALRDDVVRRAFAGDVRAVAILAAAAPRDFPASTRRGARDEALREMATDLHAALPSATSHRVAVMLEEAGRRVDQGLGLNDAASLAELDDGERAALFGKIARVLAWAPPRSDGRRWPKLRQIIGIIG
jgi:hypothetical protein